jgi:protein arginine kinase activator
MQCDICSKKKATVHLTEIVDEQMSEMHLCEECARQKSAQMEQQFGLADLLAGLSDFGKPSAKESEKSTLKCTNCGLLYEDFRKFGRLGCGQCYTSFKENLSGLLKKIHGSSKHLGKSPVSSGAVVEPVDLGGVTTALAVVPEFNLDDLKKELHAAIEAEDFEKAAALRDKIRSLEQKD